MNDQLSAFYAASGIQASTLNFVLRLTAGLLLIVASVFILIGLIKMLEDGQIQGHIRFILYLMTLATIIMIFFTFVTR